MSLEKNTESFQSSEVITKLQNIWDYQEIPTGEPEKCQEISENAPHHISFHKFEEFNKGNSLVSAN